MRVGGWLASAAGILVGTLLLIELLLQVASLFAGDRASAWRPRPAYRVLCVGDSHTWGAGVERGDAYPSHLQRQLDAQKPGAYSVMNLGLPGMSTTQVRNRLATWLSRYEPDALIVWAGVNDAWNRAEVERETGVVSVRVQALLGHSRLARFVKVWLHDRTLERYAVANDAERVWSPIRVEDSLGAEESWTVQIQARVEANLELIAEYARGAGIPPIVIAYPNDASWYAVANRALRAAAERHDLPLVESGGSVARIPEDEQVWLYAAHPDGRAYGEIARDLVPVLTAVQAAD
jgi:lysophospholipase L1-like esterase